MKFIIQRFNPDVDKKPYYKEYTIDRKDISGTMLLHALESIKEQLDSSLTFRRSCGSGVCGSDGMNINGLNGLACMTLLDNLPDVTRISPLPSMPIIRDLVVDLTQFYKSYEAIQPFLISDEKTQGSEMLQSKDERLELDGLYECIMCACCSTMCPSYWWNPDKFIGPAGLLTAARFIFDSRDSATESRLEYLSDLFSLYRCRSIMNCIRVCPKSLNPTKAIAKIRDRMKEKL